MQRGRPGRWNPDPLGLQADITTQQQQKERGRERRTGSAKWRSISRPRDDVKRGRRTPSSDDSEPAIDWNRNKIGPATWESAGPQAPKSPARTSHTPSSTRGNSQPAPRYSQSRPAAQKEKEDEATHKEKARLAKKQAEEEIILKHPNTYISTRIGKMITERFTSEARSLRFYGGSAVTCTREIVALANWGYQYCLLSHSPLPDILAFLQQSCFGSKNAVHNVPDAPLRILLETADIRKRSQMLWTHLCCLLQFWTDEAGYLEGNIFYGGLCREMSDLVQYVMMRMNNCTRGETVVTWRDVVRGTPWLDIWKEFSAGQEVAFRLQPAPTKPNELEREMEAWWQVEVLRKKCAAPPAASATAPSTAASGLPPDAPPNTPATDTETGVGPGPGTDYPAGACSRPPPGINMPPSNQFIPTADWTRLPNPRDNPASTTKYRTPFNELDLELGRSSLVETPLSRLETEEAIDRLLKQCLDLPRGPAGDVEMMDLTYTQTPDTTRPLSDSPVLFQPEIMNTSEYNYNLMDQEGGISAAPASPVTPEDDELLDAVYVPASPVPDYSRAVGTGCPKSMTPKKKFGGTDDPEEHK